MAAEGSEPSFMKEEEQEEESSEEEEEELSPEEQGKYSFTLSHPHHSPSSSFSSPYCLDPPP